ncbi:MAG: polysaccharide deacetylase family protein [Rubrobacter sp.]|nr:polysaccharide deacetylase family protein [Rubrobacter sp.]
MIRWPPVLMYHAITRVSDDPNKICIPPEKFEAQMRHLKRHGWRGISMHELGWAVRRGRVRGLVGLTFDDGYENFLQNALPVLERFGFSATAFVLGGMMGRENDWDLGANMKLLDAEGVREVSERGLEIGSHGMNHVKLSALAPELLEKEVSESKQVLGEVLGKAVEGFCYPYGSLDSTAVEAVRRAGYGYACAYKRRIERSMYDIPRIYVGEKDGPLRLAMKLRIYSQYAKIFREAI